jgi:hypothetical protein
VKEEKEEEESEGYEGEKDDMRRGGSLSRKRSREPVGNFEVDVSLRGVHRARFPGRTTRKSGI